DATWPERSSLLLLDCEGSPQRGAHLRFPRIFVFAVPPLLKSGVHRRVVRFALRLLEHGESGTGQRLVIGLIHRRVAVLSGQPYDASCPDRLRGFLDQFFTTGHLSPSFLQAGHTTRQAT